MFFGALSPNLRSKLQNLKWWIRYGGQNFNFSQIKLYFDCRVFLERGFLIRGQNWKIKNGGSNFYKYNNIVPSGIYGALNPNLRSKLQNSKWSIEYVGRNFSVSHVYCRKFLNIFLKLILKNPMAKFYQINKSTALRKLSASAIGSVFKLFLLIILST